MRQRQGRREGFTLVEVLLTLLVTSILVLGINGAYQQAHLLWSRVENERDRCGVWRALIETMRMDLLGVYLPRLEQDMPAFSLSAQPEGSMELCFYTLSPGWRSGIQSARSANVAYRFTKDTATGQAALQRLERPCSGEQIIGERVSDIVAQGTIEFEIQAVLLTGDSPEPSLETSYEGSDRAPKALRVSLRWLESGDLPETAFETLLEIPCEQQLLGEAPSEGAT